MKVGDFMISDVCFVSPSTPVIEVAHQMKVSGRRVIPVCDGGKFLGVITERDIVTGVVADAGDPVTWVASSVISCQPTIAPDADIMEAIKLVGSNRASALAVVQNGKLVGLLTLEDLVRESLAIATLVLSQTIQK